MSGDFFVGNRENMDTQTQRKNWEKLYGKSISETDYTSLCQNLSGFFSVLRGWDNPERKSKENERNCDNGSKHIPDTP